MGRKRSRRPRGGRAEAVPARQRGARVPRPLSLSAPLLLLLLLPLAACERREVGEQEEAAPEEREEVVDRRRERHGAIPVEGDHQAGRESRLEEEPILDEEIALPKLAELPSYDFSSAPEETEPNGEQEQASPLGSDGDQFVGRGRLVGNDHDWFVFTAEGEPQLWTIEAIGDNLHRLEYFNAVDRQKMGVESDDPRRSSIASLYLLPGRHWLRLRSREGDAAYTLRAVALGPPDPRLEREPNDDVSRAHLLSPGAWRVGFLLDDEDDDYYHFSLTSTDFVELRLVPPADQAVRLKLWDRTLRSTGEQILRARSQGPGEEIRYRALLPPGSYVAEVSADDSASEAPYRLRLARLDPFDLPADLEPNDRRHQARPLPATLRLKGEAEEYDEDWYRLPALSRDTDLVVEVLGRPEGTSASAPFRLYREGEERRVDTLQWDEAERRFRAPLTADTGWLIELLETGPYDLRFAFDEGPLPEPDPGPLPVNLSLPAGPYRFAAYWHEGQHRELPLSLQNTSAEPLRVFLDAAVSHHVWRAEPARPQVELRPNQRANIPVTVSVPPDVWADRPVEVTLRARDQRGAQRTVTARMTAECGAPPVGAKRFWPLPKAMLGGLNVAWSALGSRPLPENERFADEEPMLYDGITPNDRSWFARRLPATLTVELAGEMPVPVVGLLLNPRSHQPANQQIEEFSLELSKDGREYRAALSGVVDRMPVEQAYLLDRPTEARFARLHVHTRHAGTDGDTALGELKVVAAPGFHFNGGEPFNLANPAWGGHVVWSDPLMSSSVRQEIITEEAEHPRLRMDSVNPNRWVVGFHHDRAAQITELQWAQSPEGYSVPYLSEVQVAVSTETPVGPWSTLGTWSLDPAPARVSTLRLPAPAWARYLRISTTEPDEPGQWHLPETLRILERPADDEYRSILGEWGHYSREAVYEMLRGKEPRGQIVGERDDNESRETAQELEPGQRFGGEVLVGEDVDWYRVEVPARHNRLRLEVKGDPTLRVAIHVEDEAGEALPLEELGELSALQGVLDLAVDPGSRTYVRIEEPPRSIVLCWDNSSSTNAFKTTLYQALPRFVAEVQPGLEFANLLPFRDKGGSFLLEEWSDQPYALQSALNDYPRDDGSSEAESALLTASEGLADRIGTRAVVLLTDAETHSYNETAKLWRMLGKVRPRVFTVELHRGDAAFHQDLMQDWAAVNQGVYDFFRTHADLEVAFDRASCHLRRPARYTLAASTRFEKPPGPGTIRVRAPKEAIAGNAIELIVDASGSMLQRLEGRRRVDIAREVLLDLVENVIPAGTPLALRVFGHRTPRACQTDLEVAVEPLDAAKVGAILRQVEAKNYAKTPIGRSLELVAEDLKGAQGQKIVVLVTDGEETCGGDPAAAIDGLKDQGIDVRVNIVGFAIEDEALKKTFRGWAELGGGLYFNATSGEELGQTMRQALQPKFQVLDPAGEVVASAVVGGDGVSIAAGLYTVRVLTTPPTEFDEVRVRGDDIVELDLEQ